jgi:hypothetical protein
MKMNKQQMEYMAAKCGYEAACEVSIETEKAFCKRHDLRNPDGSAVTSLCSWDAPDGEWDAMVELEAQEGGQKACEAKEAARLLLVEAENALIDYALSIVPESVSEKLRRGVRENYRIREQVLDMAFRLDVSTVPEGVLGEK